MEIGIDEDQDKEESEYLEGTGEERLDAVGGEKFKLADLDAAYPLGYQNGPDEGISKRAASTGVVQTFSIGPFPRSITIEQNRTLKNFLKALNERSLGQ